MRVAWITDVHVRQQAIEAHREILVRVSADVARHAPDLIGIGGDLAGWTVPYRTTTAERAALTGFAAELAAIAPVVGVRGNHDPLGEFDVWNYLPGVTWFDRPGTVDVDTAAGPARVVALPWIDESALPEGSDYAAGVADVYRTTIESCRRGSAPPTLVFGHAAFSSAALRPGQPKVPTHDPELDGDVLPRWLAGALFGHYHHHQRIEGAGCPAWYGGSLFFNEYGEAGPKGWTLYDSASGTASLMPVEQPMRFVVRVRCPSGEIEGVAPDVGRAPGHVSDLRRLPIAGHHVKIVGLVKDVEIGTGRAVLAKARSYVGDRAASVRMDFEIERTERVREGAREVASANTLEGKVTQWFDVADPKPSATAQARSLGLLKQIEAEVDSSP